MYAPVRGGNRGGQDRFKWDDVKLMSYKDRECYLGASQTLGFLDKGGTWRKRDWYVQGKGAGKSAEDDRKAQLKAEVELQKREEKALMNFKLGIKDDLIADCTDVKQVLERVRGQVTKQPEKPSTLSDYEIKQLTQRTGQGGAVDDMRVADLPESELITTVDKVKGIGFDRQHMVSTSAKGLKLSGDDFK